MRHHRRVAVARGQQHGVERLRQRSDLVDLDQDRVRRPRVDPALQPRCVRHEHVVADQLHPVADALREEHPAVPVVLGHAVLDGHDRVPVDER